MADEKPIAQNSGLVKDIDDAQEELDASINKNNKQEPKSPEKKPIQEPNVSARETLLSKKIRPEEVPEPLKRHYELIKQGEENIDEFKKK